MVRFCTRINRSGAGRGAISSKLISLGTREELAYCFAYSDDEAFRMETATAPFINKTRKHDFPELSRIVRQEYRNI